MELSDLKILQTTIDGKFRKLFPISSFQRQTEISDIYNSTSSAVMFIKLITQHGNVRSSGVPSCSSPEYPPP